MLANTDGGVVFCVTVTDDERPQPFTGFVTVTVYVPCVVTVKIGVTIPATDQLKLTLDGVDPDADSVTLGLPHVILGTGCPITATGRIVSYTTVTLPDAEQPFDGFVAVTWYTPPDDTVVWQLVVDPLTVPCHPYVTVLGSEPQADNGTLPFVHVSGAGTPIDTIGFTVSCNTDTDALAVQPLYTSVTVKV